MRPMLFESDFINDSLSRDHSLHLASIGTIYEITIDLKFKDWLRDKQATLPRMFPRWLNSYQSRELRALESLDLHFIIAMVIMINRMPR